jgi:type III secretory pathway component EscV
MRYRHEDAYRLGIGRALFLQGSYDQAVDHLRRVTGESEELIQQNWRTDLVFALLPSVSRREAYGPLKAWLEEQWRQAAERKRSHAALDAQAATLWLVRDRYWQLYRTPHGKPPPTEEATGRVGVAPLTLIVDPALLPTQAADSSTGAISEQVQRIQRRFRERTGLPVDKNQISERVHELQRRIKEDTGFLVPTPFIRGDPRLPAGAYRVLVHEVPVALGPESGRIVPEARYCSQGERCRELGLRGTRDGQGVWLPERAWKRARESGLLLEDPIEVLRGRLERILRRHLPSFVGVQEVQALVDDWSPDHQDDPLPRQVTTGGVPVRFVKVLRGLAEERVSVSDLKLVCEIFAAADESAPPQEIIGQVRMRLAPALPGCQRGARILGLSAALEAQLIAHLAGPAQQPLLLMARTEAAATVAAVQTHVGDGRPGDDVAVIVRESRLRSCLRRLLASELPDLPVLSMQELARRPGGSAVDEEVALPVVTERH